MNQAGWMADFEFGLSGLRVKKTGARIQYSSGLVADALTWNAYYKAVRAAASAVPAAFSVSFAPDRVRPWYLVWPVVRLAGGRIVDRTETADVVFHFEDESVAHPLAAQGTALTINCGGVDVRKSAVASAFEASFGYTLAVDPRTHIGPAVEKSEVNGAHDGRVVICPMEPRPDRVYQRVIDNLLPGSGLVEDIRTPTIGGEAACVYLKRRPFGERFANANTEVALTRPEDVLTATEREQIRDFCGRLNLQWGGLDILRDGADGKIYIVDANKTDMGPPLRLPLAEKLASTHILARRFLAYINAAGVGTRVE